MQRGVVQRRAIMLPQPCPRARAAANQVRATMPPGGMVAGVHMERVLSGPWDRGERAPYPQKYSTLPPKSQIYARYA
jgi:hypothetical protein